MGAEVTVEEAGDRTLFLRIDAAVHPAHRRLARVPLGHDIDGHLELGAGREVAQHASGG